MKDSEEITAWRHRQLMPVLTIFLHERAEAIYKLAQVDSTSAGESLTRDLIPLLKRVLPFLGREDAFSLIKRCRRLRAGCGISSEATSKFLSELDAVGDESMKTVTDGEAEDLLKGIFES